MTITVRHIITIDDSTKNLIERLIAALGSEEKVGQLADKLKANTDNLEQAVENNKGTIS